MLELALREKAQVRRHHVGKAQQATEDRLKVADIFERTSLPPHR